MRAPLLFGFAGSLVLTALVATPAGSAPAPPASAEARGTAVAVQRAAAAGLKWAPCAKEEGLPDTVKCASVTVPVDYAHPDGEKFHLTVSHRKAKGEPSERQGALVYNPGGPGASGTYWPLATGLPEWERLARAYDFVGYAPRGVDRSARLSCQDPEQFEKAPTPAPTHPDEAYKKERVARAKAYARGCARAAGESLRHYTTRNNARDLEVLRAALGERKLNFMGASYGTYFGAVYATMFPSHVRRMVFDSAVDPDPEQIWYRNNLDQSLAFEARWSDFRTWVAKHDKSYELGKTPRQVQRSYDQVLAEVAHEPAGGKVGPGQLQSAFLQVGYNDDYWPRRAAALSAYLKGDTGPLVEQAGPSAEGAVENENGNAVYTAVECNDSTSWPTDFRVWDRDNTALARIAPFETWDNVWMNLPCAYWPAPRQQPVDVRTAPGALPPTLILAAERDAATPHEGAVELHRRLPGSALVTERDSGTHGIGGGSNKCVNKHLDTYLLTGKTPRGRAECAPHAEPKPDPK
ncbi:alpha/beta hydrolase [Streptomyces boluensis]|uniref:Alpha/beta fold hydrolase n=1 Tax=Streptomyces boluensis TaxID=1775135 RepID=A0A964UNZ3_9ACTN|nr:alpha/beta hydrolase [Streptomyces boluensis]NBE51680.1 alpha/beta fold hydrolase [Streptomyces boluensis]